MEKQLEKINPGKKELQALALAIAPFLVEAGQRGNSMVEITVDPAALLGLPTKRDGAGRVLIAVAAGSSINILARAIELAKNPQ
jgi:hypothetical protein